MPPARPDEVPHEVLAMAVAIALERRLSRSVGGPVPSTHAGPFPPGHEPGDHSRWRWGPEAAGWS